MKRTGMAATRWMLTLSAVLGLLLVAQLSAPASLAVLREAAPPQVGGAVLDDPLTAPGVLGPSSACPSGKNVREFVGDGTIIKVTGRCNDTSANASLARRIDGLTLPDGEVRVELKVVSGHERARFYLHFREASQRDGTYSVRVDPAAGGAQLRRTVDGQLTVLDERTDLAGLLSPGDWNSLAVRMQGPDLWVLLNDQLILAASDDALSSGSVVIALVRTGELDDAQEAAVVVRNLRVSALAAGDQARLPSYQSPRAAAPAAAPSGAPVIDQITFGYDRSGAGAVPSGGKLADVSAGDIYGFFSWRNIPPGSRIGVRVLWGGEVRGEREFSPSTPDGRTWVGIMRFDSEGDGGARFTFSDVGLVFLLDGKEIARGSAALP